MADRLSFIGPLTSETDPAPVENPFTTGSGGPTASPEQDDMEFLRNLVQNPTGVPGAVEPESFSEHGAAGPRETPHQDALMEMDTNVDEIPLPAQPETSPFSMAVGGLGDSMMAMSNTLLGHPAGRGAFASRQARAQAEWRTGVRAARIANANLRVGKRDADLKRKVELARWEAEEIAREKSQLAQFNFSIRKDAFSAMLNSPGGFPTADEMEKQFGKREFSQLTEMEVLSMWHNRAPMDVKKYADSIGAKVGPTQVNKYGVPVLQTFIPKEEVPEGLLPGYTNMEQALQAMGDGINPWDKTAAPSQWKSAEDARLSKQSASSATHQDKQTNQELISLMNGAVDEFDMWRREQILSGKPKPRLDGDGTPLMKKDGSGNEVPAMFSVEELTVMQMIDAARTIRRYGNLAGGPNKEQQLVLLTDMWDNSLEDMPGITKYAKYNAETGNISRNITRKSLTEAIDSGEATEEDFMKVLTGQGGN